MSVQGILYEKGGRVITVDRNEGIGHATELMRDHTITALPVTQCGSVVGILTSREIIDGLARHGSRLLALPVSHLMRRDFVRTSPQESLKRVTALMTRHRTTHIPVFCGEQLVGIVSVGDVLKHRLEDLELEFNVLRDVYIAAH